MTDAERTPQECLKSNFYGNANGRMVEEAQSSKNKGTAAGSARLFPPDGPSCVT